MSDDQASGQDCGPDVLCDAPGSAEFLQRVSREVLPYVESHFRTHPFRVLERSWAIHDGQEEEYASQIERLESLTPNDR